MYVNTNLPPSSDPSLMINSECDEVPDIYGSLYLIPIILVIVISTVVFALIRRHKKYSTTTAKTIMQYAGIILASAVVGTLLELLRESLGWRISFGCIDI